jgi:hypothetical protein
MKSQPYSKPNSNSNSNSNSNPNHLITKSQGFGFFASLPDCMLIFLYSLKKTNIGETSYNVIYPIGYIVAVKSK